jgi:hypothetical protein
VTARELRAGLVVALLGFVVALYVRSVIADVDGYGTAALARALSSVFVIAPSACATAAWRGSVLRRAAVRSLAPVRSAIALAWRELRLIVFAGWSLLALAVVVGLVSAMPLASLPGVRLLAVSLSIVVAFSVLGFGFGSTVSQYVAVPVALVVPYLWFVFPPAFEPLWIRHLTGFMQTCCLLSERVAPGAIVAPIVVAGGLACCGIALASQASEHRWRDRSAAILVLVGTVFVASRLVIGLGADPTTARPASDLVCRRRMLVVCVWPENRRRITDVAHAATDVRRGLEQLGISIPPKVTEGPAGRGDWVFGMRPSTSDVDLRVGLVASLVPHPDRCKPGGGRPQPGDEDPLIGWMALRVGVSWDDLQTRFADEDLSALQHVRGLPEKEQRRWASDQLTSLGRCS